MYAGKRFGKSRGSFMPILFKVVQQTHGPILELGVGFCSTPYLHWACYPKLRRLVSYEHNPAYFDFARSFEDSFHEIHCLENFDEADWSEPWSVVFVDHSPSIRRSQDMPKLVHADFIVVHDTEGRSERRYRLSTIYHLFKYQWKWTGAYPQTTVLSNKYDLRHFDVW